MVKAAAPILAPDSAAARDAFARDGLVVVRLFSPAEAAAIETFAKRWLERLLTSAAPAPLRGPIEDYHHWFAAAGIDHGSLLRAANRHSAPQGAIRDLLTGSRVMTLLENLVPGHQIKLWDEGLGWLAFRLVRPNFGDGYSLSCKAWGPAPRVMSLWIPVVGFGPPETIGLVAGSHRRDYPKYLPSDTKFNRDEWRLTPEAAETVTLVRPALSSGDVVVFGPKTLHTEDVVAGDRTRLSLEVRFDVVDMGAG